MDDGLLSISPACCGHLAKILINLKPEGIFGSNFAYLFILILSKQSRGFAEHHFGPSGSLGGIGLNS